MTQISRWEEFMHYRPQVNTPAPDSIIREARARSIVTRRWLCELTQAEAAWLLKDNETCSLHVNAEGKIAATGPIPP